MISARLSLAMSAALIGWLCFGPPANASDITGLWSTDPAACNKIFQKKGGRTVIADDADLYGSGFIIEQNQIRGKIATCNIKARKVDGAITHFIASCSTDIALQNVQFSLKTDGENKITRIYPGVPELSTNFFRCAL